MANVGGVSDAGLFQGGSLVIPMGDANQILLQSGALCWENRTLNPTGALTATRDVVVPLIDGYEWIVQVDTTGGHGVRFIGASGTGITVADAKTAVIRVDGVNVRRVTADV